MGQVINLTPENRLRQLRDEDMTCGNQPAYIRMINRRFNDPVPANGLKEMKQYFSFHARKANSSFLLTTVNHISECIPHSLLRG